MKYLILIVILSLLCSAAQSQVTQEQGYDQARLIAIQDFAKTKLYKKDSVFYITLIDTFHRVAFDTISKNNYRSKRGQAYPNIIAIDILGWPVKYFLDTTVDLNSQKGIPSRFIIQNGKIFVWRDKHYKLADSTIKMLDKYNLIGRGGHNDWYKFIPGTDDAKQGAQYYFCRDNLTVFKRIITNKGIEWYDPPKIKCKQ